MTKQSNFSNVEKTALVLLGMGNEAASEVLKKFSQDEIKSITHKMSRLQGIKMEDAKVVIESFFNDFSEHSGISGASKDYLTQTLNNAFGKNAAKGLLADIYGDEIKEQMEPLKWVDPKSIAHFILNEHPQIQAIFLAHMPSERSSLILKYMPNELQDEVIIRIAKLKDIEHEVITDLIELVERAVVNFSKTTSKNIKGVKYAADILNHFDGDRNKIMETLKSHDERIVHEIEENMFAFVILERQSDKVLNRLIQEIDLSLWSVAFKGCDSSLVSRIKEVMPERTVETLEDEMERKGAVPLSKVNKAREDIMNKVRELSDNGEIDLSLYQEETVE
ncbi:flagellar motor switch protein FliG [Paraphotobacterium marinum]|uniref:Flagellar motor switch protein FliG n=1 Tax=Paraphotobacterium marinum TaxID=1755811 RepID=A0A220VB88_9GAMM|nr:FliG C-terminal domain-containing protein [Paraphotobacterium marinum]ASK77599.1 flagellar motor switch protein FliG [Paraphotobacterium marinum]